jgi:hypothetical protein
MISSFRPHFSSTRTTSSRLSQIPILILPDLQQGEPSFNLVAMSLARRQQCCGTLRSPFPFRLGKQEQELEEQWGEKRKVTWTKYATWQPWWQSNNGVSCQVQRRIVTVIEIFVFKRFQPILFGLFEFDPKKTLSVIDPTNLRYHEVIAVNKDTCELVARNLVTAN